MELPLAPRNPENVSGKLRHGDAPLRRSPDISERSLVRNEEAPPPQAQGSLFDRVLRKKHAIRSEPDLAGATPSTGIVNLIFNLYYQIVMRNNVIATQGRCINHKYNPGQNFIDKLRQTSGS